MRNPVTDLTTMLGTTDIEDWVAFEAVARVQGQLGCN